MDLTLLLFIPLIMVVCGFFMYKLAPKEINGIIGYRTGRSMKNGDTWHFANNFCGKLWVAFGLVLLISSVIVFVVLKIIGLEIDDKVICIIEAVQLVIMLGTIIPVEISLKRTFDENGSRR